MVYKIKNIDEAFISDDSVRTNYKKYYNWFNNQDFSNLTKKNQKLLNFLKILELHLKFILRTMMTKTSYHSILYLE